jgi:hypothetical protein
MNDPRPDPAFAEALLAQEPTFREERYAAYRRTLDQRIEEEARRRRSLGVRLWSPGGRGGGLALAVGAAAALAALLVLRPWGAAPPAQPVAPAEAELILLRLAPPNMACPVMEPFGHARDAKVIVLGALGAPLTRDGKELVRVHVERVLKGELPGGPADTYCLPQADWLLVTCRSSARVLLYLTGSREAGWTVQHVEDLEPGGAQRRLDELERTLQTRPAGPR